MRTTWCKVCTLKGNAYCTLKVLNFPCPVRKKKKKNLENSTKQKNKNGLCIRFFKLAMSYLGQNVMLMRSNRAQYRNNECKSLEQLRENVSCIVDTL